MNDEKQPICRHCHVRIRRDNYGSGTRWVHVNGVEFEGYWYCKITVAGPVVMPE